MEHRGEPFVAAEVPRAERDGVGAARRRELVDVRLAGEGVRGRGERPVRTLRERRLGGLELDAPRVDLVGHPDPGRTAVHVAEMPGEERAVGRRAGPDVDDGGGTGVPVLELLLPGPPHLHGPAGGPREHRGLHRGLDAVLAPEPPARDGNDHAKVRLVDAEPFGDLTANAERNLRAGPHGEAVTVPLRDRDAGLERRMGEVGGGVRRLDADVAPGQRGLDIAVLVARRTAPALDLGWVRAKVVGEVAFGGLRFEVPFRADGCHGSLRLGGCRRNGTDDIVLLHHGDALERGGVRRVGGPKRRADPGRPEPRAVQHSRHRDVARKDGSAGHGVDGADPRMVPPRRPPRGRGGRRRRLGHRLHPGRGRARALVQQAPGRRGRRAKGPPRVGRRSAAERPHVERAHVGVAHHEPNPRRRDGELLRHQQRQSRPVPLAGVDLPGERGDDPVGSHVQPSPATGGPRAGDGVRRHHHDQARRQHVEPVPILRLREVPRPTGPGPQFQRRRVGARLLTDHLLRRPIAYRM